MNSRVPASRRLVLALLSITAAVAMTGAAGNAAAARSEPASPAAKSKLLQAYDTLPLAFIRNAGQADRRVRYYAQGSGYSFAFTRKGAVLGFAEKGKRLALGLGFLGARAAAAPEGQAKLPGTVNYLIGSDPAKWHTGLPTFGRIAYRNLWPGIDMLFEGGGGTLQYEFLVRAGASVRDIGLAYRGAEGLSLDRAGALRIGTRFGALSDTRPRSYELVGDRRVPVKSRFVL